MSGLRGFPRTTFTRGWYQIGWSAELPVGEEADEWVSRVAADLSDKGVRPATVSAWSEEIRSSGRMKEASTANSPRPR